jgi:hypothetical protein
MASVPRRKVYFFIEQGMHFTMTITLRVEHIERWIHCVHQEFLDCALEDSKCVGLEYEYIDAVKNVKQRNLPLEKKQCSAILHLSVVSETLVFQICHTDAVSELVREFMNNDEIMFWGAANQHDVQMLKFYGITIPGASDL